MAESLTSIQLAEMMADAAILLEKKEYDKAEDLACKLIQKLPQDGFGHLLRLLAYAKVSDPMALPEEILSDPDNELFRNAFQYGDKDIQNMLLAAKANCTSNKLLKAAQEAERTGRYDDAYDYYKALGAHHNGHQKTKEIRYKQAENAFSGGDYKNAVAYFTEARGFADSSQKLEQAKQALQVRKSFEAEVGKESTYIERQLQTRYPAELKQYRHMEQTANRPSWCHGVGYLIAAALMVVSAVAMCFDTNANNSFIYLLFGVCWAFVIHKVFDWDFHLFKSGLTGFLCAAAPFVLRWLSDSLFDTEDPAFYVAVGIGGIIFLRALLQQFWYIQGKKAQKQKVQFKLTVIDPKINEIRKALVEKYSAQLDRQIVQKWVRYLTLR